MTPIRIADMITTEEKPVMCCICFDAFAIEDLNVLPSGQREDVCKGCANHEGEQILAAMRGLS